MGVGNYFPNRCKSASFFYVDYAGPLYTDIVWNPEHGAAESEYMDLHGWSGLDERERSARRYEAYDDAQREAWDDLKVSIGEILDLVEGMDFYGEERHIREEFRLFCDTNQFVEVRIIDWENYACIIVRDYEWDEEEYEDDVPRISPEDLEALVAKVGKHLADQLKEWGHEVRVRAGAWMSGLYDGQPNVMSDVEVS